MPNIHTSPLAGVGETVMQAAGLNQRGAIAKRELDMRQADQASIFELRKAQLEIEAAQEVRAKERHAQDLIESQARIKSNEQASMIQRGNFEMGRLEDAKAAKANEELRANSMELDRAAELAGLGSLDDVAKEYPDFAPQIEDARKTLGLIQTPKARAMYGLDRAKALHGQAQAMDIKKATAAWNDALRQGAGMGGAEAHPDLLKLSEQVKAGMELHAKDPSQGIDGKTGMTILQKKQEEIANDRAIVKHRQKNAPTYEAQYMPLAKDKEQELRMGQIIARYEDGMIDDKQVVKELDKEIAPPKLPEQDKNTASGMEILRSVLNIVGQGRGNTPEARAAAEKDVVSFLKRHGVKLPGSMGSDDAPKAPKTQAEAQARLDELVSGGMSFKDAKAQLSKEIGGK